MQKFYDLRQRFKLVFLGIAGLIIILSVVFTNNLAKKLADEEKLKIELWAEAYRMMGIEDNSINLNLILKVISNNNTIPVFIADSLDNVIFYRNVEFKEKDTAKYLTNIVRELKLKQEPIKINITPEYSHFLYYNDSTLLLKLAYFPYVQITIIILFFVVAFIAFGYSKKAEENQVWVGLSKETAHQLGTPISSLLAWIELMKEGHNDPALIPEMDKDIQRLKTIAERFSRIGSQPILEPTDVRIVVEDSVNYLRKRVSNKICIKVDTPESIVIVPLNISLFEWVIENLVKNSVDAINDAGKISIRMTLRNESCIIDFEDTGRGIAKKKYKTIFNPGYTTKQRGWGLGLSLARRIVVNYHKGRIFVKTSEINKGTIIRIALPLYH